MLRRNHSLKSEGGIKVLKAPLRNQGAEGTELEGVWEGSPSPLDKRGYEMHCELFHRGPGHSPRNKRILRRNTSKSDFFCIIFVFYRSSFHIHTYTCTENFVLSRTKRKKFIMHVVN